MKKLMLLDGNSLINRAFYGVRPLNAPDGTPTNAVYGFLAILQKLLEDEAPDGLAVAFDRKEPTFRHRHSAAYKATRRPMPEELAAQMPVMKEVLDAMGVVRCELPGWEADDILRTLSLRAADEGIECVVVTGDKDACSSWAGRYGCSTSKPAWARRRRSTIPRNGSAGNTVSTRRKWWISKP